MRRASVIALLLASMPAAAEAQGFRDLTVLDGRCTPKSHVAEGRIGTDLTKAQSRFFCDSVAIIPINGDPRHVLLTFSEKRSHTRPQIGFSGYMPEPDMIQVQRVYLQSGVATLVDDGACKLFRKQGRIDSLVCGAKIDQGDRRTVPVVAFQR